MTSRKPIGQIMKRFWGGFVDGKIDIIEVDTGFGGFGHGTRKVPAIFARKIDAAEEYQEVRPIDLPAAGRNR